AFAIVGDFKPEAITPKRESLARLHQHLLRRVHHRDTRPRKGKRDERRQQTGARAEVEHLDEIIAFEWQRIDGRAIELVEARNQPSPRAIVGVGGAIEQTMYGLGHDKTPKFAMPRALAPCRQRMRNRRD